MKMLSGYFMCVPFFHTATVPKLSRSDDYFPRHVRRNLRARYCKAVTQIIHSIELLFCLAHIVARDDR